MKKNKKSKESHSLTIAKQNTKQHKRKARPSQREKIRGKNMSRKLCELHSNIHKQVLYSLCFLLFSLITNHDHSLVKASIFIYAGCSQEKYTPNSPFEANVNSFLSSIVSSSSQSLYNSFALGNGTSPPVAALYGLYQCRGDLQTTDCSKCIEGAVNQIGLVCPYSYGASLQLEGCYARYEHVDFLGKLDTSLRYKKCSKSVNNDVEFFRRRDDVLADLQTGIGFKVSSSALVQGSAQCLGDLSSSDCSNCLADAVGKLKNLCGSAAAANVFLAQCYARYLASDYYDSDSPDSSSDDDMGKTVAIVVGVLAGLAVLIVLLSVCRKSMG